MKNHHASWKGSVYQWSETEAVLSVTIRYDIKYAGYSGIPKQWFELTATVLTATRAYPSFPVSKIRPSAGVPSSCQLMRMQITRYPQCEVIRSGEHRRAGRVSACPHPPSYPFSAFVRVVLFPLTGNGELATSSSVDRHLRGFLCYQRKLLFVENLSFPFWLWRVFSLLLHYLLV